MNNIAIQLITMFGIGRISKIPGTIASFVTCLFYFLCIIFNINIIFLLITFFIILIVLLIIFFYSFSAVTIYIEDKENKDPKEVIVDEFIGQSIPIYLYEISHCIEKSSDEAIIFYGILFILFRFFDIVKPFPVSFFDKNFKNSFGVIMDDVCAGLYVVLSIICFMVLSSYFI